MQLVTGIDDLEYEVVDGDLFVRLVGEARVAEQALKMRTLDDAPVDFLSAGVNQLQRLHLCLTPREA